MLTRKHPDLPYLKLPAFRPTSPWLRRLLTLFMPAPKRRFLLNGPHRRAARELAPALNAAPAARHFRRTRFGHPGNAPLCAGLLWSAVELELNMDGRGGMRWTPERGALGLYRAPLCLCAVCLIEREIERNPHFVPLQLGAAAI